MTTSSLQVNVAYIISKYAIFNKQQTQVLLPNDNDVDALRGSMLFVSTIHYNTHKRLTSVRQFNLLFFASNSCPNCIIVFSYSGFKRPLICTQNKNIQKHHLWAMGKENGDEICKKNTSGQTMSHVCRKY